MSSRCLAAASPRMARWLTCAVKGRSPLPQHQWRHRLCNPPSPASPCSKGLAVLTGKENVTEIASGDATASAVAAMTGVTGATAKPWSLSAP